MVCLLIYNSKLLHMLNLISIMSHNWHYFYQTFPQGFLMYQQNIVSILFTNVMKYIIDIHITIYFLFAYPQIHIMT